MKSLWTCTGREKGCPATANIYKDTGSIVISSAPRNHDNVHSRTKTIVKNAVANAGINPNVSGRTVLANITATVNQDPYASINALDKKETILRSILHTKQKLQGRPGVPKDYEEFFNIPQTFQKTVDGHQFLQKVEWKKDNNG